MHVNFCKSFVDYYDKFTVVFVDILYGPKVNH